MKKNIIQSTDAHSDIINFGSEEKIAFIKPDMLDGQRIWSIYSADGQKIAATDNREFAFIVARENDWKPHSVN